MLHIIYGSDRENIRTQFHVVRDVMQKKCNSERVVGEGEVNGDFLSEAALSVGLFGEKVLFVFDTILEKNEEQELIAEYGTELAASPNYFLICEPAFEKEIIEESGKKGGISQEYVAKKVDRKPAFNIFSLGDALGRRNKKELWVLYQDALRAGIEPEEISGTLFWSVKNMMLMKDAPAGTLCGLNPFVAKKTREFAKNYTKEELLDLSHSLIVAYHEAHLGGEPMTIALERFTLGI